MAISDDVLVSNKVQWYYNKSDILGVREVGEGGVSATEESLTVDEPLTEVEEGCMETEKRRERDNKVSVHGWIRNSKMRSNQNRNTAASCFLYQIIVLALWK